ncbi:RNF11 [Cordylochernes scorpioides]|uniref:RNF11 n=1 Tax=Cordylochernes scorpioides TaxID=51811 RepID=A0ABY6LJ46_9ARAC|nr:RNF11 [Cordylochernes scorpioides]
MGNCLKSVSTDDISLLRENQSTRESTSSADQLSPPLPSYEYQQESVYYPSPNVSRPASQLTEEEQVKIAKRIGLIQHLPTGMFDGSKKNRECVICMIDFLIGDPIRFLPCMHIYHTTCIDDWLMRSFTCPSCMEPVDAALLATYQTS